MSVLVNEKDSAKRIATLKEQLHETVMKMAVEDTLKVMHTMSSDCPSKDGRLGPSVFVEVQVNGVPTKTLIDTGLPATIVSLDCILKIMASQRKSQQSPEQWKVHCSGCFTKELWWTFPRYPLADLPMSITGKLVC